MESEFALETRIKVQLKKIGEFWFWHWPTLKVLNQFMRLQQYQIFTNFNSTTIYFAYQTRSNIFIYVIY